MEHHDIAACIFRPAIMRPPAFPIRAVLAKARETRDINALADARARGANARAAEIEMRVAERKRELIPIEDATAAMDLLAGKTKEEMTGLAARITRDMILRRKIEAEMNGALIRIAEGLRSSADLARKGGDLPGGDPHDEDAK